MKKDTNELLKELESFTDFKSFYEENKEQFAEVQLSEYLQTLLNEKNLEKSDVIAKAEMSEIYAYQIISGIKKSPDRNKVLCLAFGMGLTIGETQEMLKKTGYAMLYARNPFDCVILYGLSKKVSVVEVNELLYEYGQEMLG